jgi:hypothetical protein
MKTIVKLLLVLSLTPVVGCGNKAESIASEQSQLFQDPVLKADWDTAVTAIHTNGYLVAEISLRKLGAKQNLTAQQTIAVQDTLRALHAKLFAAAEQGDLRASNAVVELQKLQ